MADGAGGAGGGVDDVATIGGAGIGASGVEGLLTLWLRGLMIPMVTAVPSRPARTPVIISHRGTGFLSELPTETILKPQVCARHLQGEAHLALGRSCSSRCPTRKKAGDDFGGPRTPGNHSATPSLR